MTDININDSSIPDLTGKHAVVTGGASGIGLACCQMLAARGASHVLMLDLRPPAAELATNIHFRQCDVSKWAELRDAFQKLERVDFVFANAGIGRFGNPLGPDADPSTEPCSDIISTNYQAALNTAVLGVRAIRAHGEGGSIVFTSSMAGLSAQKGIPVYSSLKLALIGLVRSWRMSLIQENITVNAVAPGSTITGLLPARVAAPLSEHGLKFSTPDHVARALVFSAVATESRRVEAYANEKEEENERHGRWNGRVILTMDDRYTEVEETLERLKGEWFGQQNLDEVRHSQRVIAKLYS